MTRLLRTNLCVVCFTACYFIVSFALSQLQGLFPWLADKTLLTSALIYLLSFGLPALIYVWIVRKTTGESIKNQLSLHPLPGIDLLLVLVCGILVQPVMMLISAISQLFFQNVASGSMVEMTSMPLWAMLLAVGLLPAFFEELICRGIIYNGHQETPFWYQLLIPALFFGLLHLNFQQAIYAAAAGVFMALLVRATGSLWASITAHLVVNGSQSLLVWALMQIDGYSEALAEAENALPTGGAALLLTLIPYLTLVVIALPLLILCMMKLFQRGRSRRAAKMTPPLHWHRGAWLMYVTLGFLLICTILTEVLLHFSL